MPVEDAGRAVFDGEGELFAEAAQVAAGITPDVKLQRAAQRLTSAGLPRGGLGMVHDDDGDPVSSLKFAQVPEPLGSPATDNRPTRVGWDMPHIGSSQAS